MVIICIVFLLILAVLAIAFFATWKGKPKKEKVDEETKIEPEKLKEERKSNISPIPSEPNPKPKPAERKANANIMMFSKLGGYSSEIVDMNIHYDRENKLVIASGEINKIFLMFFSSLKEPAKRYLSTSWGKLTSLDVSNTKIAATFGKHIKLFGYNTGKDIAMKDLESDDVTEGTHIGPIEYIRSTGVGELFVTCTCDDSDDVRVWSCSGNNPKLLEVHKSGQLGNTGICVSKKGEMVAIPGKGPELKIFKAKLNGNKKGEYIEKTHNLTGSAMEINTAALSYCGKTAVTATKNQLFVWRLPVADEKPEILFKEESISEIQAVDVLRPVHIENYHTAFIVTAYSVGTDFHLAFYKDEEKPVKMFDEFIPDAHLNRIKIIKLAVIDENVVVFTVASDKCIKLWTIPKGWLPPCASIETKQQ